MLEPPVLKRNFICTIIEKEFYFFFILITETVLKEANAAREHLLKALTELLLGDKLAAEYLICHLIACM